uniref:Uncharacterized protein n=1 Tax=Helianthus annuus TaxID=4232 RepID=A0A251SGJ0_HELAN
MFVLLSLRIIGFQLTTRWRFTMLWSAAAMVDAQLYVITRTIAQWYFSIDDPRVKHHMTFSKCAGQLLLQRTKVQVG